MATSGPRSADRPRHLVVAAVVVAVLVLVVLVFATIRVVVDGGHLAAGTLPEAESFERRYVENPVAAYLHIVPGVLFLLGALLQLSARIRDRDLPGHRRRGRVVLGLGLVSGVFALVFGARNAFGGGTEAAAAVVFGTWFTVALVLAYGAVRRGDVVAHRRWAVRAFAVGVGVGTIRLWVGLFVGLGILGFEESFGPAFWLGLGMHAVAAEAWLRVVPHPRPARGAAVRTRHP